MSKELNKHHISIADIITILRIVGALILFSLKTLSISFLVVYFIAGLTDVIDGYIARKTRTTSDLGAKLDSIADVIFYLVLIILLFPNLYNILPNIIWFFIIIVFIIRIANIIIGFLKFHQFVAIHTYLNKIIGVMVFLIPFALITKYAIIFCFITTILAITASLEELLIIIIFKDYQPNKKAIFIID